MAHLNYRGATSVPFVRSRGEIGFVQPASQAVAVCLPLKGGGWEIGAAAAAAAEWRINATGIGCAKKKKKCSSPGIVVDSRLQNGWLQAVFANCVYPPATTCATAMPRRASEHRQFAKRVNFLFFSIYLKKN